MFVWVFHRLSGVLLVFLLSLQWLSGMGQTLASGPATSKTFAEWHRHSVVLSLTVFLLVFHALYGVRTILLDLGVRRERLLFWCCNAVGLALCSLFFVFYATRIRP